LLVELVDVQCGISANHSVLIKPAKLTQKLKELRLLTAFCITTCNKSQNNYERLENANVLHAATNLLLSQILKIIDFLKLSAVCY